MHEVEAKTDIELVQRLIVAQFAEWKDLPIQQFSSTGTDNAIFRLGDGLSIRMPRLPAAAEQIDKENRWLPVVAPQLPLDIPTPIAVGQPSADYPFRWSICRWISGESAATATLGSGLAAARTVHAFVAALQQIQIEVGVSANLQTPRGRSYQVRDAPTRKAIEILQSEIDADLALSAWKDALDTPQWQGTPKWLHGDLHAGNLLVHEGRLSGVIDFGTMGIGDPACDLVFAWNLLTPRDRAIIRSEIDVDEAHWRRARGWALTIGLVALPYYAKSNPVFASVARRLIKEVLADFQ
jgi:aminoglycoside phosphotransferase (APT) family kinase protein